MTALHLNCRWFYVGNRVYFTTRTTRLDSLNATYIYFSNNFNILSVVSVRASRTIVFTRKLANGSRPSSRKDLVSAVDQASWLLQLYRKKAER
jgi:hypothetical protein